MNENNLVNYTQLTPQKLDEVFEKNNVYFPRKMRISVLKKVLEPKYVAEMKELEKIQQETPKLLDITKAFRLKRLKSYRLLSEFQLENDFIYYNDKALEALYLKMFWEEMTAFIQKLDNADSIFKDLDALEKENVNIETVCIYNRYFMTRVLDEENYFDGINLVEAVKHFNDTSFATEIRKLGKKYKLELPKYWTKKDLQLRLKKEMKAQSILTAELDYEIDHSSIKEIKVLLEKHNLDSKTHITKEDLINIIIKSVDKNKVSVVAQEADEELLPVTNTENVKNLVISEPQTGYEDLLKTIIVNQEMMIKQNDELISIQKNVPDYKYNKIFNYIIIGLIIVVAIIWIIYGFDTLFQTI